MGASRHNLPTSIGEARLANLHTHKQNDMQGRRSLNFPAHYTPAERANLQAEGGEAVRMQLRRKAQEETKMRFTSRYSSVMTFGAATKHGKHLQLESQHHQIPSYCWRPATCRAFAMQMCFASWMIGPARHEASKNGHAYGLAIAWSRQTPRMSAAEQL